jgi:hypothetical protein
MGRKQVWGRGRYIRPEEVSNYYYGVDYKFKYSY